VVSALVTNTNMGFVEFFKKLFFPNSATRNQPSITQEQSTKEELNFKFVIFFHFYLMISFFLQQMVVHSTAGYSVNVRHRNTQLNSNKTTDDQPALKTQVGSKKSN